MEMEHMHALLMEDDFDRQFLNISPMLLQVRVDDPASFSGGGSRISTNEQAAATCPDGPPENGFASSGSSGPGPVQQGSRTISSSLSDVRRFGQNKNMKENCRVEPDTVPRLSWDAFTQLLKPLDPSNERSTLAHFVEVVLDIPTPSETELANIKEIVYATDENDQLSTNVVVQLARRHVWDYAYASKWLYHGQRK